MNKLILMITLSLLSLNAEIFAQKFTKGIFLTADDFANNKISFSDSYSQNLYKIHIHKLLPASSIRIVNGDSVIKLKKESIYGYRDSQQKNYRFFHGLEYQIKEAKAIVIYCAMEQGRYFGGSHVQSSILVTTYYFSVGLNGKIQPLTIACLKKAFPDNKRFHELLDVEFGDGTTINEYNSEKEMFQINYLLNKSNI